MDDRAVTTVTDRGQVSIPAALRRELGLTQGKRIAWARVSKDELRIQVLSDQPAPGASSVLGFARRFRKQPRSTAEWMAEIREGER